MSTLTVTHLTDGQAETASAAFAVAPRFGMNYDVDGGLAAAAKSLGCPPFTAAKVFNSSMPASYPGHPIPASVTHPLAAIKITLTTTSPWISDADRSGLAKVFSSMPRTGTPMVTIDQEGEAGRFRYSPAQVVGAHATAYAMFRANAPSGAVYCQDFQTFTAAPEGRGEVPFEAYVCPGLPLYLMDWYPSSPVTGAIDSVTPCHDGIRAVEPGAVIGVAECNYTTNLSGGITWTGGTQADWFAEAWEWAALNDCPLFMPYFLTSHGVPWLPAQATLDRLSSLANT